MAWVFGFLAVTMGIVFLWGLFAPRSQWRALSSWAVTDSHAHEPGGATYAVRRLLSGLGVLGIGVVVAVASTSAVAEIPKSGPPLTPLQVMWGSPAPQFVDRTVHPLGSAPDGLVEEPVLGYQKFDDDIPDYLLGLRTYSLLGKTSIPGYIGTPPDQGYSALDFADLVVQVRGPLLCVPREAVIIETDTTVQIAIYYGLPDSDSDTPVDNVKGCPTNDSLTASVLIPIDLVEPVGDRSVEDLTGAELHSVRLAK